MKSSNQAQSDLLGFAIRLYQEIGKCADENVVVSPYSVSTAMALLLNGARGDTASQISAVLCDGSSKTISNVIPLQSSKEGEDGTVLVSANKLFADESFTILEKFLEACESSFSCSISSMNFVEKSEESRTSINEWVQQQTRGIIQNLLPNGSIDPDTRLVIANAIYFKGVWKYKFEKSETLASNFHLSENKTRVLQMMFQKRRFNINFDLDLGAQVLELPYKDGNTSMLLIVPTDRFGLKKLETKLSAEKLQVLTQNFSFEEVALSLPKTKIQFSTDLSSTFKALGVTDVFDPGLANLGGISSPPTLYVSAIFHKTFLEVSEEGTEAAAATAVVVKLRSAKPPPIIVKCDHPFLVLIKENSANAILFIGRVTSP